MPTAICDIMQRRPLMFLSTPALPRCLAATVGFVLLASCSPESPPPIDASGELDIPAPAGSAAAEAEEDCLMVVWEQQAAPDRDFDRANDLAEGGLISCATRTSPSQFEAVITALRDAANGNDQTRLLGETGIPLLYIDAEGNRRDLNDADLADADFEEVFSPEMLALMRQIELSEMTVVPDQGGFFNLGAIWLRPGEPGGRPQIVTLNRQALEEAAAAETRN